MKNTKKLFYGIAALLLAVGLMGCTTGCGTVQPGQPTHFVGHDTNGMIYIGGWQVSTGAVYNATFTAAKIGTEQGVRADTNSVVYFHMVQQAITLAIASGNLNPASIRESISEVGYIPSPEVNSGIVGTLAIYQAFAGNVAAQKLNDASPYLVPMLAAIVAGIEAGLPPPSQ